MKKRFISLFTALSMLCAMLPVFGISVGAYEGGGTDTDPYIISTAAELAGLA
ncbi:MAG: hypothetical protein ACI4DP_03730 [Candidatus Ornithomonoglobus sp.]